MEKDLVGNKRKRSKEGKVNIRKNSNKRERDAVSNIPVLNTLIRLTPTNLIASSITLSNFQPIVENFEVTDTDKARSNLTLCNTNVLEKDGSLLTSDNASVSQGIISITTESKANIKHVSDSYPITTGTL